VVGGIPWKCLVIIFGYDNMVRNLFYSPITYLRTRYFILYQYIIVYY
jgi:hypothetical protein